MALEYKYVRYNYQTDHDFALNAMAAEGWHVHTAMPNFTELWVLWERGDVARARSVSLHLDQSNALQQADAAAEQQAEVADAVAGIDGLVEEPEPVQSEPDPVSA